MFRLVFLVVVAAFAVEGFPQVVGGRGADFIVNVGNAGRAFAGQGGRQGFARQTVTFTERRTVDRIATEVDLVYNTLPVTFTDFRIDTQTITSREVVQTPANDVVRFTTRQENFPTTIQLTDTVVDFRFATNLGTDTVTVTHTLEDVDFVTVTKTVQELLTVTSPEVRVHYETDYHTTTEHRYVTKYKFVRAGY